MIGETIHDLNKKIPFRTRSENEYMLMYIFILLMVILYISFK